MTWHLKNRELEKNLIGLCSDFLKRLDDGVCLKHEDENYILVSFDRERSGNNLDGNELLFWADELEDVPEYNPHDWNYFIEVKPPYDVMMRVEMYNKLGFAGIFKHFIEGDQWCYANGSPMPKAYSNNVRRFRPWVD